MQKKIYCTKCGREIKEGLLYCDRCGQSVKKSIEKQSPKTKKQQQIEALQRERLNRKEKLMEREEKRRKNKEKNKKNVKILLFIVALLVIALVSAVIAYIATQPTIKEVDDVAREDAVNMATLPPSNQQTTSAVSTVNTDFKTIESNGITCPYPETFEESANGIGEIMHLNDSVGGAVMIIAKDNPSGEPKDLMSKYAAQSGGNITFSRAGDNWYAVTVTVGEQITHRKYVIKNGLALYYEFTYDASSVSAAEYEECIKNLDENFSDGENTQG